MTVNGYFSTDTCSNILNIFSLQLVWGPERRKMETDAYLGHNCLSFLESTMSFFTVKDVFLSALLAICLKLVTSSSTVTSFMTSSSKRKISCLKHTNMCSFACVCVSATVQTCVLLVLYKIPQRLRCELVFHPRNHWTFTAFDQSEQLNFLMELVVKYEISLTAPPSDCSFGLSSSLWTQTFSQSACLLYSVWSVWDVVFWVLESWNSLTSHSSQCKWNNEAFITDFHTAYKS